MSLKGSREALAAFSDVCDGTLVHWGRQRSECSMYWTKQPQWYPLGPPKALPRPSQGPPKTGWAPDSETAKHQRGLSSAFVFVIPSASSFYLASRDRYYVTPRLNIVGKSTAATPSTGPTMSDI